MRPQGRMTGRAGRQPDSGRWLIWRAAAVVQHPLPAPRGQAVCPPAASACMCVWGDGGRGTRSTGRAAEGTVHAARLWPGGGLREEQQSIRSQLSRSNWRSSSSSSLHVEGGRGYKGKVAGSCSTGRRPGSDTSQGPEAAGSSSNTRLQAPSGNFGSYSSKYLWVVDDR